MSTSTRAPSASKVGALGFAAIALGCAAFAAYLVGDLLRSKGLTGERVRSIVVARRPLPAAQPFSREDVELRSWPESSVPEGAFTDVEAIFAAGKAPVPAAGILAGEPVVASRLAATSNGTGLAALVQPGFRAVAVKVDDSIARAGLVYPGVRVDVMATIRDPEGRGPSTRIAVENVRVLAVESRADVETQRPKEEQDRQMGQSGITNTVVTLEVRPHEAEVVALAQREGSVDLAVRNAADQAPVDTHGATPMAFSAFAPDVGTEELPTAGAATGLAGRMTAVGGVGGAGGAGGVGGVTRPARAGAPGTAAEKKTTRRIELRAGDEADLPASSKGPSTIETYHAN